MNNILTLEDQPLSLEDKCRRIWGINSRMIPVLKLVFVQGWQISKAARAHGYNGSYAATVIRKLRADGHEPAIKEALLQGVDQNTLDNLDTDFWESLQKCIKSGEIKALELYATIKGMIQKQPGDKSTPKLGVEELRQFMEDD